MIKTKEALPTSFRALPAAPPHAPERRWSLLLFYQYKEPAWTESEHKKALSRVIALGEAHGVTGRGRCAAEGLNCTLTAESAALRQFCHGLRDWKPDLFDATDFKFTDGLQAHEKFKALTIRKTDELVGYGLAHDRAPKLEGSKAKHLGAVEYHAALEVPGSVVIDVRNAYETEIGRFEPPPGGAELIDPKIRNSHEFPKWLGLKETQDRLKNKTVMMYCTGGIRCERASALVDAMRDSLLPKEILMVRGGIERYVRTFPEGGYFKGANYLFDRRFEQRPLLSTPQAPLGACAACGAACDEYRGQFACCDGDCKVPVIVCAFCRAADKGADAAVKAAFRAGLRCRLCREGHVGAKAEPLPDCVSEHTNPKKRKAADDDTEEAVKIRTRPASSTLFVGNLPYTVDRAELLAQLSLPLKDTAVAWLVDEASGLFYGSAFLKTASVDAASKLVLKAARSRPRLRKRKLRVGFAPEDSGKTFVVSDRPPPWTPRAST